jgi:hypothetical protein
MNTILLLLVTFVAVAWLVYQTAPGSVYRLAMAGERWYGVYAIVACRSARIVSRTWMADAARASCCCMDSAQTAITGHASPAISRATTG